MSLYSAPAPVHKPMTADQKDSILRTRFGALALALALGVLAALPARAAGPALDRSTDLPAAPPDPHRVATVGQAEVAHDLFEGLTRLGRDGVPEPGLCEGWEVAPGGLRWTFRLRAGLRWSDGEPLAAAQVAAGIARALDPAVAGPMSTSLLPIRGAAERLAGATPPPGGLGVSAPDPRTVVVELARPAPHLPGALALPAAAPWRGGPEGAPLTGTGAFRLAAWEEGRAILERNPHYHDAASVRLGGVAWHARTTAGDAYNRFLRGGLDLAPVPVDRVERAVAEGAHRVARVQEFATTLLLPNHRDGRFGGRRGVRRALLLALDPAALLAVLASHEQWPAAGIVPPGIPGYEPLGPGAEQSLRDAEARSLLREAGHGPANPLRFRVDYANSRSNRRLLEAVAARWRSVLGVEAELAGHDMDGLVARVLGGRFEMALVTVYGLVREPGEFLSAFAGSSPGNVGGYRDPGYEDLLAGAQAATGPGARLAAMRRVEARLLDEAAAIPVDHPVTALALSARVRGWPDAPHAVVPSRLLWAEGPRDGQPGAR